MYILDDDAADDRYYYRDQSQWSLHFSPEYVPWEAMFAEDECGQFILGAVLAEFRLGQVRYYLQQSQQIVRLERTKYL
jgi:hypothetical protein